MIERTEIDKVAHDLQVRVADVERDYVNGWLLNGIFGHSALASVLALKGGNALRKAYFENTRYSRDLDFTVPGAIDREQLRTELESVCGFVTERTGVRFLQERLQVEEKRRVAKDLEVLEVRAYFLDFYGEKQTVPVRVYMDVTQYDKLLLPVSSRGLIHPYSDAADCVAEVRCMALEEILASKLKCLLQRRHSADLFDYMRWIFFEDVAIDRGLLLKTFLKKTIYERAPGAAFELLLNLPFSVIGGLWNRFLSVPSSCVIGFEEGVNRFKSHLEGLFGAQRAQSAYRLSFFPSRLREPIMNAGRDQRLIRLVYDGRERQVEPYALKYKVRQDGGGGEYFYAFDRTGGTSSGPGMKTFVPEKIVELTELQETFEPRFEIEIAKAGELSNDVSFRGRRGSRRRFVPGFGIVRSPRIRTGRIAGPRHRFRCSVCGKLFLRKSRTASLKKHKDRSGSDCYGVYAIYEGYY